MSNNGKTPLPFQAPAGTPLVGQPLTVLTVGVPINMTLTCNCSAGAAQATNEERPILTILNSAPVACAACGTKYGGFFNPQTGQIQMVVERPPVVQVPS